MCGAPSNDAIWMKDGLFEGLGDFDYHGKFHIGWFRRLDLRGAEFGLLL